MEDEVKKSCEAERDEYLAGWKRAAADLANYQKEEGRRIEAMNEYACVKILREILPVLDSFGLALKNDPDDTGVLMIRSQLEDFLKKQNVERIIVSPGDALDLTIHEPVVELEMPDHPELAGKIAEELSPGYRLGTRVIRAVRVKVGK